MSATNVQGAIDELSMMTVSDLSDVTVSSPTNGDALIYDSINQVWANTGLAAVATSGSYTDLSNKPTIYTYTIGTDGNAVTLTPSSGTAQSITVPYATSAGSATDSTKVAKAGDTMTGDLRWEINGRQGLAWKEYGYGDKFEIRPYFSGSDDSNYLAIQTATGGAGTDPGTTDKFKFYPSGNSMFLGDSTSYNYTAASANSPAFISKVTNVDASKGNNNISSGTYYPCYQVQDNSGRILARIEGVLSSSGTIGSFWYVRNYNTSGTMVAQKGISMTMDKSGNLTYAVADPSKFRSAISALGNDEYTSAGITFNSTYVSSGGATCYRSGRSVFVKVQGLTVKNVSGRVTIGTIPAGYRPIVETSTFGLTGGHFLLEPNGEFKSEGFTNATAYESSAYLWSGG